MRGEGRTCDDDDGEGVKMCGKGGEVGSVRRRVVVEGRSRVSMSVVEERTDGVATWVEGAAGAVRGCFSASWSEGGLSEGDEAPGVVRL